MFKKEVTYQLSNLDIVVISGDGIKAYKRGKLSFELNKEQTDKIIEEYEEIRV